MKRKDLNKIANILLVVLFIAAVITWVLVIIVLTRENDTRTCEGTGYTYIPLESDKPSKTCKGGK